VLSPAYQTAKHCLRKSYHCPDWCCDTFMTSNLNWIPQYSSVILICFPNILLTFSPTPVWRLFNFSPVFDQTTSVNSLTSQHAGFQLPATRSITCITQMKPIDLKTVQHGESQIWLQKALEDNGDLYWKFVEESTKTKRELIPEHITRFPKNCFYTSFSLKSGSSWQLSIYRWSLT